MSWIPVVLLLFAILPPRRAVIVATVTAWLSLPGIGFNLPGLPDYTKTSATVMGVLLGMAIFDSSRLLALRPHWFDLPVVVWCTSPFVTALTNDLGAYDGLSMVVSQAFMWGVPYLIGRAYLADAEGLRELAAAIVVGGLLYVPLCLWEIRMSPNLAINLYGIIFWDGERYGGYRPRVFMNSGLELGMWMTAASLTAYWLWATGALRQLWRVSFGTLLAILLVTTVLCKSTGALLLLLLGLLIYGSIARLGWAWPVWVLVLAPPSYEFVRATGIWSGRSAVEYTEALFGKERGDSVGTRIWNEDILAAKALQRPFFGWGGYNRARVFDASGKDISLTDGYWIITLGNHGLVNLVAMNAAMLLPLALLTRRVPPRLWTDPRHSPAAVLAVLLGLYVLDNLSNAMLNPVYAIAIGGVTAFEPARIGRRPRGGGAVGHPAWEGARGVSGAGPDGGTAPAIALPRAGRAGALDHRGRQSERRRACAEQSAATARIEALIELYRRTAREQEELVSLRPRDAAGRGRLAQTCIDLGRLFAETGQPREVKRAWLRALDLLAGLVAEFPEAPEPRARWLDHLNNLAWLLATKADEAVGDPALAVTWAATAVAQAPDRPAYWNTLGVSRYRAGDGPGAIEALRRSVELAPDGTSFDHFYLALAHARGGDPDAAGAWFAQGVAWMERHRPRHDALWRLRAEASAVLDGTGPPPSGDLPRGTLALPQGAGTADAGRRSLPPSPGD